MTEEEDPRFTCANYRVRLFLSVDLSGSTAFKNSEAGEERERASPKWVTTFETFYRDFPAKFRTNYASIKNPQSGNDGCPSLWKAVGDELIFCGRVNNRKSIITALMSFIHTLHDYRKLLTDEKIPLNLKGAGWLAAFPEPNRAVQLRNTASGSSFLTASEALEAQADEQPFEYDFLGKAIDTGFRVAGFAKPERFVLSVQLARLLVSCQPGTGFDHPIRFANPTPLKGVNGGESYPVLYIDTMLHLSVKDIRLKERQLLKQHDAPDKEALNSYLEEYCSVVGTEEIALSFSGDDEPMPPPESYLSHKEKISEHLAAEKGREIGDEIDEDLVEANDVGNGGEIPDGDDLKPLA